MTCAHWGGRCPIRNRPPQRNSTLLLWKALLQSFPQQHVQKARQDYRDLDTECEKKTEVVSSLQGTLAQATLDIRALQETVAGLHATTKRLTRQHEVHARQDSALRAEVSDIPLGTAEPMQSRVHASAVASPKEYPPETLGIAAVESPLLQSFPGRMSRRPEKTIGISTQSAVRRPRR